MVKTEFVWADGAEHDVKLSGAWNGWMPVQVRSAQFWPFVPIAAPGAVLGAQTPIRVPGFDSDSEVLRFSPCSTFSWRCVPR